MQRHITIIYPGSTNFHKLQKQKVVEQQVVEQQVTTIFAKFCGHNKSGVTERKGPKHTSKTQNIVHTRHTAIETQKNFS